MTHLIKWYKFELRALALDGMETKVWTIRSGGHSVPSIVNIEPFPFLGVCLWTMLSYCTLFHMNEHTAISAS